MTIHLLLFLPPAVHEVGGVIAHGASKVHHGEAHVLPGPGEKFKEINVFSPEDLFEEHSKGQSSTRYPIAFQWESLTSDKSEKPRSILKFSCLSNCFQSFCTSVA